MLLLCSSSSQHTFAGSEEHDFCKKSFFPTGCLQEEILFDVPDVVLYSLFSALKKVTEGAAISPAGTGDTSVQAEEKVSHLHVSQTSQLLLTTHR